MCLVPRAGAAGHCIGEPEAPLTIQFLEHSYLLLQELDLLSLVLVEPSRDGEQHYFDGCRQRWASLRGFQIRLS